MRKLNVLSGVLLIMALTASFAHAGTFTFGLKGGAAIPMGDLGDLVDPAPSGGVYADYWVSPTMAFGADIAGDFFKGEVQDPFVPTTTYDLTFSIIQFGVHGMYAFPMEGSAISPFIQYGVAMYNGATKVEDLDIDDSSTKFGFNGGLGVNFGSSPSMKFGVGAEYHYIMLDEEEDFSSSATYLRILARLTFGTTATTQ